MGLSLNWDLSGNAEREAAFRRAQLAQREREIEIAIAEEQRNQEKMAWEREKYQKERAAEEERQRKQAFAEATDIFVNRGDAKLANSYLRGIEKSIQIKMPSIKPSGTVAGAIEVTDPSGTVSTFDPLGDRLRKAKVETDMYKHRYAQVLKQNAQVQNDLDSVLGEVQLVQRGRPDIPQGQRDYELMQQMLGGEYTREADVMASPNVAGSYQHRDEETFRNGGQDVTRPADPRIDNYMAAVQSGIPTDVAIGGLKHLEDMDNILVGGGLKIDYKKTIPGGKLVGGSGDGVSVKTGEKVDRAINAKTESIRKMENELQTGKRVTYKDSERIETVISPSEAKSLVRAIEKTQQEIADMRENPSHVYFVTGKKPPPKPNPGGKKPPPEKNTSPVTGSIFNTGAKMLKAFLGGDEAPRVTLTTDEEASVQRLAKKSGKTVEEVRSAAIRLKLKKAGR